MTTQQYINVFKSSCSASEKVPCPNMGHWKYHHKKPRRMPDLSNCQFDLHIYNLIFHICNLIKHIYNLIFHIFKFVLKYDMGLSNWKFHHKKPRRMPDLSNCQFDLHIYNLIFHICNLIFHICNLIFHMLKFVLKYDVGLSNWKIQYKMPDFSGCRFHLHICKFIFHRFKFVLKYEMGLFNLFSNLIFHVWIRY